MKEIYTISFLLIAFFNVNAQNSGVEVAASGGDAQGAQGSFSYTIGQVVYTTHESGSSMALGIQRPFEISVETSLNENNEDINLSVYPNPTAGRLELMVSDRSFESLSYQLYDINGKLLNSEAINNHKTIIELENLPVANYLLKVIENQVPIKTFKIIKT
jgi:hypothetical protein